jgi:hypothetical protein
MLSRSTLHIAHVISPVFPGLRSQPFTLGTAWLLAPLLLQHFRRPILVYPPRCPSHRSATQLEKYIFTNSPPTSSRTFSTLTNIYVMSAPPQQRKKAHKQTVARDLRGDLARESPAISSPASQASAASLASGAGMAAATIPSPPPNTAVTCTRLPHRGYIPPHAITGPSPETSSQPGSLNHGPSAGESSTYQARPYVPFRANHPDRVHVGPW